MLQATHGVVSGSSSFFNHAYGRDEDEFKRLLSYPHGFIFHRRHFENGAGKSVRDEYEAVRQRMTSAQQDELLNLLAACSGGENARVDQVKRLAKSRSVDAQVRQALTFHLLGTKADAVVDPERIVAMFPSLNPDPVLPTAEEFVEDAGLFEPEAGDIEVGGGDIIARSVNSRE